LTALPSTTCGSRDACLLRHTCGPGCGTCLDVVPRRLYHYHYTAVRFAPALPTPHLPTPRISYYYRCPLLPRWAGRDPDGTVLLSTPNRRAATCTALGPSAARFAAAALAGAYSVLTLLPVICRSMPDPIRGGAGGRTPSTLPSTLCHLSPAYRQEAIPVHLPPSPSSRSTPTSRVLLTHALPPYRHLLPSPAPPPTLLPGGTRAREGDTIARITRGVLGCRGRHASALDDMTARTRTLAANRWLRIVDVTATRALCN